MKLTLPMRVWRWVFVALYALVMAGLVTVPQVTEGGWSGLGVLAALAVLVLLQAVFIFGCGTVELGRPISGWRLLIPLAVAAIMMAILIAGQALAVGELLDRPYAYWIGIIVYGAVGVSWICWGALSFIYCRGPERFVALRWLTTSLFAGSLVVLLTAIPAHIIVSRRPGCFVGLGTAAGVAAGAVVMFWSLGPGIILLFLHEKRRFELREAKRSGTGTAQPPAG